MFDDLFDICINKSRMNEQNINKNINNTIKYFISKFINDIHKKNCK